MTYIINIRNKKYLQTRNNFHQPLTHLKCKITISIKFHMDLFTKYKDWKHMSRMSSRNLSFFHIIQKLNSIVRRYFAFSRSLKNSHTGGLSSCYFFKFLWHLKKIGFLLVFLLLVFDTTHHRWYWTGWNRWRNSCRMGLGPAFRRHIEIILWRVFFRWLFVVASTSSLHP